MAARAERLHSRGGQDRGGRGSRPPQLRGGARRDRRGRGGGQRRERPGPSDGTSPGVVGDWGPDASELVREESLGLSFPPGERGREAGDARRAEGLDGRTQSLEVLLGRAEEAVHRPKLERPAKEPIAAREAIRKASVGRLLVSWTVPPGGTSTDARGQIGRDLDRLYSYPTPRKVVDAGGRNGSGGATNERGKRPATETELCAASYYPPDRVGGRTTGPAPPVHRSGRPPAPR